MSEDLTHPGSLPIGGPRKAGAEGRLGGKGLTTSAIVRLCPLNIWASSQRRMYLWTGWGPSVSYGHITSNTGLTLYGIGWGSCLVDDRGWTVVVSIHTCWWQNLFWSNNSRHGGCALKFIVLFVCGFLRCPIVAQVKYLFVSFPQ
jgi:hypothetical protein